MTTTTTTTGPVAPCLSIPPNSVPFWKEDKYEFIDLVCESVESYRPGGYLPVHLGDTFNNDQYKVIRKLGSGRSSTVWLARDQTYVAPILFAFFIMIVVHPR